MTTEIHDREKQIIDFFYKYPNIFTDMEQRSIINYTKAFKEDDLVPDIIREVYDELGFIPDNKNIYIGFMNLVSNMYDLKNKNIIEVGGGVLPRLGKRISATLDNGTITVYDPRLSHYEESNDKLKLVKDKFKRCTSVGNANLILGLMTCEAAETIVESAIDHKIDFVLALCEGGPHGDEYDYFEDEDEWRNSLIRYASREVDYRGMGELKKVYLKEYGNPYPIIYNDRG